MFDDDFIENLPEDHILALKEICNRFFNIRSSIPSNEEANEGNYEAYLEAYGFLEVLLESLGNSLESELLSDMEYIRISSNKPNNVAKIINFFSNINLAVTRIYSENVINNHKSMYGIKYGLAFAYEFSDNDFDRVQKIITELRELIAKSEDFEEDHKTRLHKRLEKLQSELHKKMSSLDRFWGLFVEAGVALGKFGKEAEPFVKLVKELTGIVWRTQAKSEGLSGNLPLTFTNDNKLEN